MFCFPMKVNEAVYAFELTPFGERFNNKSYRNKGIWVFEQVMSNNLQNL